MAGTCGQGPVGVDARIRPNTVIERQSAFRLTGSGQSTLAYCFGEQLYQPDLPVRLMLLLRYLGDTFNGLDAEVIIFLFDPHDHQAANHHGSRPQNAPVPVCGIFTA
jgi:hypothetical protein